MPKGHWAVKMQILVDPEGSISGLKSIIESAGCHGDDGCGLLLLASDMNDFTPGDVDPLLRAAELPVFGGTFPAVMHGRQLLTKGTVAVVMPVVSESRFIPGFDTEDTRFDELIESTFPEPLDGHTMVVFVDGLAKRIGAFIEGLFNTFGLDLRYVGGGAGSLSMRPKACLFTNEGLREGGAVIALIPCRSGVGVCHGWEPFSGPYYVTEAHHNEIRSLDWRPAYDVYAEALGADAKRIFSDGDFFEVAKSHPFGISRLGTEQIVRDPLRLGKDKALVCAGEVPEGSFVHILHGNEQSLIDAAGAALTRARHDLPGWRQGDLHLFMDCISRALFLGDRFQEEMDAVCHEGAPFVGACTIGEISNSGAEFLEFFNKTAVVAVLDSQ